MITITVTEEQIQEEFNKSMENLFSKGNYSNPVKSILDNLLGYSGAMKGAMGDKIKQYLETQIETPDFQQLLGKSIADEMARRVVDSLDKSNK